MADPDLMKPTDVNTQDDPEADELENASAPGGRDLRLVEDDEEVESTTPSGISIDMLPPDLRQMAEENPQQAATVIHNALNIARNKLEEDERRRLNERAQQNESVQAQANQWFQDTYEQEYARAIEGAKLTQYSSQAEVQRAQQQAHLHALDVATTAKADMLIEAKLSAREQARIQRQAFLNDPSNEDLLPFYGTLERLTNEGHDPRNVASQLRQIMKDMGATGARVTFDDQATQSQNAPLMSGLTPLQNRQLKERLKQIQNPLANRGAAPQPTRDQMKRAREITKSAAEIFWGPKVR